MNKIEDIVVKVLNLDAAATPGDWYDQYAPEGGDVEVLVDLPASRAESLPEEFAPQCQDARPICDLRARTGAMRPGLPHPQRVADAALIGYYRTAAPALAREVQRLQAELKRRRPSCVVCGGSVHSDRFCGDACYHKYYVRLEEDDDDE